MIFSLSIKGLKLESKLINLKTGVTPLKIKTHSGAKKRFRAKPSGIIKRKKKNLRHLLINKSSKRKRHLGVMTYVSSANKKAVDRLLGLR